jgi:hypothetical protein
VEDVGVPGPLLELPKLIERIEDLQNLHSVDYADAFNAIGIVTTKEHGKNNEFLSIHVEFLFDDLIGKVPKNRERDT